MNGKALRIALDVALTLMIVFEMFIQYTGDFLHEVVGAAFFLTVVVHLALSWKWMKKTASAARAGRITGRRTALAVMGILLAICMVVLGVSSVAISNVLASAGFAWTLGSYALWVDIHTVSSYALCALVALHLAMHWAFLFNAFKVPYNPERRKAIGVGVHTIAAVGVLALGVTAAREVLPQVTAQAATTSEEESSFVETSDIAATSSSAAPNGKHKRKGDYANSSSSQAPTASGSSGSAPIGGSAGDSSTSESSTSEPTVDSPTATGICTLCRKQCSLSNPKCDKPYNAGLI